jgi:NADH-quinone oxidoreductase subunit I
MNSLLKYLKGLFIGIKSLLVGMSVTWDELWTKKVTQQYPENRKTLVISDRFRCELVMPHDDKNEHACTACGICQMNCPNGTISISSKMIETEEGKKKKILDKYVWDLGMCTFCNLCVVTCPSDAIVFNNQFENAVFTRSKLVQTLNKEGSTLREKKKEVKPAEPKLVEPKAELIPETKPVEAVGLLVGAVAKAKAPTKKTPKDNTVIENEL